LIWRIHGALQRCDKSYTIDRQGIPEFIDRKSGKAKALGEGLIVARIAGFQLVSPEPFH
jgi:hypothetical protein